ncbi:hypothetical protein DJ73_10185 [Halorubrum sp. Ea1]|uniref:PD-(D/E)XK nuclease family protein n=1 Tax=Halorubrum sp. Ea1 TaxID=1480718 RepID=UPI000B992292|nr:PD-(D/E)XK nuclease family protein [Halorubrum sp. Ea1]OYR52608.1 hypothetical protein DJ73_10185 [Halorubrum sp. Ea1]
MTHSKDESYEALRNHLEQLSGAVQQIPTPPSNPESVLSILGEARSETSWEALLTYFLNPTAPHGIDTDILSAFFDTISATTQSNLSPRSHQLSEVEIETQIVADDGVPDLLLWVPDEWFCCVELKSHSAESNDQTLRYATSESLGPLTVGDFDPTDRHYLYLVPEATPPPASDAFATLHWEAVVGQMRTVLNENRGRYPVKSSAQLADFLDTIDDELNMTDQERYQREKAQLVIDHNDALQEVLTALDDVVTAEIASWQDDFADVADSSWNAELAGNKYARVYRDEWVRPTKGSAADQTPVVVYELQIDADALRSGTPQIELKRTSDTADPQRVYNALYQESIQEELQSLAPRHDVRIRGQSDKVHTLETNIDIDLAGGDTIGGQFAIRVNELGPINRVIDQFVADLD